MGLGAKALISAKIILDSLNYLGTNRLTTMELTYPRFIHSEFMTHRAMSRNAASSRAIPVYKNIEKVKLAPVVPIEWGKNKKGMQHDELLTEEDSSKALELWLRGRNSTVETATELNKLNVHKQLVNRLLEPFNTITVIVSATEWSNFFASRCHEDAEGHIHRLADLAKAAYDISSPVYREWHTPYVQQDEESLDVELRKKISVARCARVSYLTHDGVRDVAKDLELYERLTKGSGGGHWSPFEHVAQSTEMTSSYYNFASQEWEFGPIWCGNFRGWIQYRKTFGAECKK